MSDLLHLNIRETIQALAACARAGTSAVVIGPPGVGKTSILGLVAKEVDLELQVIVGGLLTDRDDIAGTPYVAKGELSWCHRAPIRAAIERPCLLVIDELTTAPENVGGPLLALLLGRMAGDTPLHAGSRVIALANDPQHAPSARRLSPAEANRLGFYTMQPTVQEVSAWFAARPESALAEFGLLLPHRTEFVQLDPPAAKVEAGKTWGSPRAWEQGLRAFHQCDVGFTADKSHKVGYATLSAFVGADLAGGYLALRAQRKRLPAFDDILRDPKGSAKGLDRKSADVMLAALGAVPSIAGQDTGAAWIWTAELPARYIGAAASALVNRQDWAEGGHGHSQEGRRVQMKALADLAGSGTGF